MSELPLVSLTEVVQKIHNLCKSYGIECPGVSQCQSCEELQIQICCMEEKVNQLEMQVEDLTKESTLKGEQIDSLKEEGKEW